MIAVVGCGLWGINIIRTLSELKHLYAVCDINSIRENDIAKTFHTSPMKFDDILKDPSILGVVLSVPVPLHASMALAAIHAGKHVWIEKPMTLNVQEAQKICATAKEKNVQILVGHVVLYHGAFQVMNSIVKAGEIGKILHIDCVRHSWGRVCPWEKDALWSLGIHDISLILALVNRPVLRARKCIQSYVGDQGTLFLTFDNEITAKISSSWCYPIKEQRCVVIGSCGSLVFDDTKEDGQELAWYRHHISQEPPFLSSQEMHYVPYDTSASPLKKECQAFITSIKKNISPQTSCEDALLGIEILARAEEIYG